jgi:hypothetical protein
MRRVKINYSLLALSYLEVLLWVFCLLSCASAASAGTVNSQCQFEHSTVGLFKTTLGTPVLLPELRTDAAALELARRVSTGHDREAEEPPQRREERGSAACSQRCLAKG